MKSKEDILQLERTLSKLENLNASFDYLQLSIASPKRIKSWAERILPDGEVVGEVAKAETINFRTHQPEVNGLFCEKIFGPIKNWKCKCGKYNGFLLDKICEECKVEIIEARVRRYRMGYIDLTSPVAHLWYLKGIPSYLTILLRIFDENLTLNRLEDIIYMRPREFKTEEVLDKKTNTVKEVIKEEKEWHGIPNLARFAYYKPNVLKNILETDSGEQKHVLCFSDSIEPKDRQIGSIRKRAGAEVIKAALESLNLKQEIKDARNLVNERSFSFKKTIEESNTLYESMLDKTAQSLENIISNTKSLSKIQ